MRGFHDAEGRAWDAVVGRESWGAFFAIFVPARPGAEIRQAPLASSTWGEAERELDAMEEAALRELLGRSALKPME